MIKKLLSVTIAVLLSVITMQAQTATENHLITLSDGQTWKVPNTAELYAKTEEAMCADYTNKITSSAIYRAMGGDKIAYWCINQCFPGIIGYIRNSELHNFSCGESSEIAHKLVQNKRFRGFLSGNINDMLVTMCQYYPTSTKQRILYLLDKAIKLTDQMSQHNYKVVKVTHRWKDGDTWTDEVLQKDGKLYDAWNVAPLEIDWVYGLEGTIIRRVLYDGISLNEIKGYFQSARQAVAGTDVSENATYAECYTINQEIKVWIAMHGNKCQFNSGKTIENVSAITYLADASGVYYKIVGQYKWMKSGGDWKNCAKSVLYDNRGTKIHEEIVTK